MVRGTNQGGAQVAARRIKAVVALAAVAALGTATQAPAHDGASINVHALGQPTLKAPQIGTVPASAFEVSTGLAPSQNASYVSGDNGFTGGHVVIQGDRMYVGWYGVGLRIYDIATDPSKPRLIGTYAPGGARADAPPDAADYGDRRFAVLNGTRRVSNPVFGEARTDKAEFLDTTDAANPILLHRFIGQDDGESHNGDIVDSRRLWFPSGGTGANGLRIYDLTPTVTAPANTCRPYADDNPCKPAEFGEGWDPVALWEASPYRNGKPVGAPFTHTHDITIYENYDVEGLGQRDIALLAEGGNYTDNRGDSGSAFVIDVTDPANPVVLLRWLHERGPGHHPIRYHHEAQFLDSDRHVMLVTDEDMHNGCGNAGGITTVRLSPDLQSATELSEWFIPLGTPAPVCSVHVFSSQGSTVYVGSYNAGLQILDYADPSAPQRVGYYTAEGATSWGAQIHEGLVYVGDMSRGLDVIRPGAEASGGGKGKGKGKGKGRGRPPR
jgi:hypothetical protein